LLVLRFIAAVRNALRIPCLDGEMTEALKNVPMGKKRMFEVGEIALRANRSVEPMRWVVFTVNETYLPLIEENPADYKKIRKVKNDDRISHR